ncbi:MAG: ATP-grasp domain-containing protein [Planctomycetaceae bacterium]
MASSSTDLKPESSTSPEQEHSGGFRNVRSIILCGASVRSLAQSAINAGLRPLCVDFFEDADLTRILGSGRGRFVGRIRTFEELPYVIHRIRSSVPLLWAGGLENHSSLLRAIRAKRPVIGPDPKIVDLLRQPRNFAGWLSQSGLNVPRLASPDNANADCLWLRKPNSGSGGLGIRPVQPKNAPPGGTQKTTTSEEFLQEYIDGVPMSAVFCSDHLGLSLLGTSIQLVGWPSLGASDFLFCGNVGPVNPGKDVGRQLMLAAKSLVNHTGLKGVFGVDFVLRQGEAWFLEVNPRPTASHMLYENPTSHNLRERSLVTRHLAAFGWKATGGTTRRRQRARAAGGNEVRVQARLILWANQSVQFTDSHCQSSHEAWTFADIPQPGSAIPAGSPLCSVHVTAGSQDQLLDHVRDIQGLLLDEQQFCWPEISQQLRLLLERFYRNCQRSPKTSDQTISS